MSSRYQFLLVVARWIRVLDVAQDSVVAPYAVDANTVN